MKVMTVFFHLPSPFFEEKITQKNPLPGKAGKE
jgi:hypothetical protein